jgi:hypothetical protein
MAEKNGELPDVLMGAIRAVAADESMTLTDRRDAIILIADCFGLWELHEGKIDPSRYAIPEEQWTEVAGLLTDMCKPQALSGVNAALSWMNSGPSSYLRSKAST